MTTITLESALRHFDVIPSQKLRLDLKRVITDVFGIFAKFNHMPMDPMMEDMVGRFYALIQRFTEDPTKLHARGTYLYWYTNIIKIKLEQYYATEDSEQHTQFPAFHRKTLEAFHRTASVVQVFVEENLAPTDPRGLEIASNFDTALGSILAHEHCYRKAYYDTMLRGLRAVDRLLEINATNTDKDGGPTKETNDRRLNLILVSSMALAAISVDNLPRTRGGIVNRSKAA